MSPRAACRLETLGVTDVYDYVAGKLDWRAHNLPTVGTAAQLATIGRYLRTDAVTVAPDEHIVVVRDRLTDSSYGFALVTATDGTLLGRMRKPALDRADPNAPAAAVMEPGPSTLRPHEPATDIHDRLRQRNLTYAIVTDPEGHLLGTFHAADLD